MSRDWTSDEVVALAPDPASAKAGRGLASPGKWESLGRNDAALWGLCKGSGVEPYQVRIDAGEPAFRCSCPSRKIPCKHVIGLFLIYAEQSKSIPAAAPPAWVAAWLEKRQEKAKAEPRKAAPKKSAAPADPAQRAEREAQRRANIQQGLDELARRLGDVVRGGLASALDRSYQFWDESAKRLIDAQAPGIARHVRELAGITAKDPLWAETLLAKSGRLQWIIEAWRRIEALAPGEQADLRSLAGWPVPKEDVLALEAIVGRWRVMSVTLEEDDQTRIRTERVWLWEEKGRRAALLLEFAHMTQPLAWMLSPGAGFEAEIVYYPGETRQRALIKSRGNIADGAIAVKGYSSFAEGLEAYAAALEGSPWIESFPMLIESVVPWRHRDSWRWIDSEGATVPMAVPERQGWKYLAQSGGRPVQVFGEWQGESFAPLPGEMNYDRPSSARIEAASPLLAEIAHAAMLGASRQAVAAPAAEGAFRSVLDGIVAANEPEAAVLLMAGAIDGYRKMGRVAFPYRGDAPDSAPEESLKLASAKASSLLAGMLEGRQEILIGEWLALAAAHRRLAPASLLPGLLTNGERDADLRHAIAAAGGERARWLARFRPEWNWATRPSAEAEAPGERMWDEGDRQDRVAYLRTLRAIDAARARETLAAGFAKEGAGERAAFLAELREGLSGEDEDFLNLALSDKSAPVRQVAAQLLSALPGSTFAGRMRERLGKCVKLERKLLGKRLAIEPPEVLDPAAMADGILEKGPARQGFGEKAGWLAQIAGLAPLDFWEHATSGMGPADILQLLEKTDWRAEIGWGLTKAATHQSSVKWASALLHYEHFQWGDLQDELFARLPAPVISKIAADLLSGSEKQIERGLVVLHNCRGPWPVDLSRIALARMRAIAANSKEAHWTLRDSFRGYAVALAAELVSEAIGGWDQEAAGFKDLTSKPDHFISILQTRKTMIEEFQNEQE